MNATKTSWSDAKRGDEEAAPAVVETVAQNLQRLRLRRRLSLEQLAKSAGISRGMLIQIEAAKSAPTIGLLGKIAQALDVPLASLLDEATRQPVIIRGDRETPPLQPASPSFAARSLFPANMPRNAEFYELRIRKGGEERLEGDAPGTCENLVLVEGLVEIEVDGAAHRLKPDDAIQFDADKPRTYRNLGPGEARLFVVVSYDDDRIRRTAKARF